MHSTVRRLAIRELLERVDRFGELLPLTGESAVRRTKSPLLVFIAQLAGWLALGELLPVGHFAEDMLHEIVGIGALRGVERGRQIAPGAEEIRENLCLALGIDARFLQCLMVGNPVVDLAAESA